MTKIVVIGAGCAGISAAVGARKAGAEVVLLERQDQLLGIGRIAGSMDVGGRYPLHLEIVEMGGGEVNEALDACPMWRIIASRIIHTIACLARRR